MINLNGNLLCAIDVETTGLDAETSELVQVAILPLKGNLEVDRVIIPFNVIIAPEDPDSIDPKALKINRIDLAKLMVEGMTPYTASILFDEWFERLNLSRNKRISPIAHNWIFDKPFIEKWLGKENFSHTIDGRYRDTMSCALFLNDWSENNLQPIPFPKVNLKYLASCLKIEWDDGMAHEALYDCLQTSKVYKQMIPLMYGESVNVKEVH